jgi:hypothetical protein
MYKRWKTAKQEEKEAATIQEEANAPKKHSKKRTENIKAAPTKVETKTKRKRSSRSNSSVLPTSH